MDPNVIAVVFVFTVIISMILLQQWIIPYYVSQQNQTTAIHWTLVAGNAILILFNIYRMNPVGAAISGVMVGQNATQLGGKRR